jgi:hypothetical protein
MVQKNPAVIAGLTSILCLDFIAPWNCESCIRIAQALAHTTHILVPSGYKTGRKIAFGRELGEQLSTKCNSGRLGRNGDICLFPIWTHSLPTFHSAIPQPTSG